MPSSENRMHRLRTQSLDQATVISSDHARHARSKIEHSMMSGEPDRTVGEWSPVGINPGRTQLRVPDCRRWNSVPPERMAKFSALKKNGLKFIHSNKRMRITHELATVEIGSQQTSALNKSAGNPIFGRSPVVYYSCKAVISRVFYGQ